MKCKPNCAPGATLSKTRRELLWRDPLANTGEPLRLDTGRILGRIYRQGILSGILGGIHWRLLCRDTRDPLASYSGDTQLDTRRDPLSSYSGTLSGILGGIHWLAGSTGDPLWRTTRRDPLASRAGLAALSASRHKEAGRARPGTSGTVRAAAEEGPFVRARPSLPLRGRGYLGEPLWRDTRQATLVGYWGGIHWRAALAGYSAGSTGELLWRDTRRDPLTSCSGKILGGGMV